MKEWGEWKWNVRDAGPTVNGQHSFSTAWSRITERLKLSSNLALLPFPTWHPTIRQRSTCMSMRLTFLISNTRSLILGDGEVKIRWDNKRLCCLLSSKNVCWWDHLVNLEAKVKVHRYPWMLIKHSQFNRQPLQHLRQLRVLLDIPTDEPSQEDTWRQLICLWV